MDVRLDCFFNNYSFRDGLGSPFFAYAIDADTKRDASANAKCKNNGNLFRINLVVGLLVVGLFVITVRGIIWALLKSVHIA